MGIIPAGTSPDECTLPLLAGYGKTAISRVGIEFFAILRVPPVPTFGASDGPPNTSMTISDHTLHLAPRGEAPGVHMSIANDELQSSNQEVLSGNQELQSTNDRWGRWYPF
jgi:hypothetical protein